MFYLLKGVSSNEPVISISSERTSRRSHHSRYPGWYRGSPGCHPCAPVHRNLPIPCWSFWLYLPFFQLLVCSDVWVARLGLHLADDGALARPTWSLDIPGSRHPLLSEHRLDSDDWSIHLAGCILFYPLQWHHPAVLHATRREDSFCHGVIRVLRGVPAGIRPISITLSCLPLSC